MTFEELYSEWIARELNKILPDKITAKSYTGVAYKPLYGDVNEIAVIVDGGNAQRAGVASLDRNTMPLSVMVICKIEYESQVITAINDFQKASNSTPYVFTFNSETVTARTKFLTPFVMQEQDYPTKAETIKAAYIQFSATVIYGENGSVTPHNFALTIGSTEYTINGVYSYDMSAKPSYDTYLKQGSLRAGQIPLSRTNAYQITILKAENDTLQTIFDNELKGITGGLFGNALTLTIDETDINITTYEINESYTPDGASYTLILGV